jgi:dienelactone hydrolase
VDDATFRGYLSMYDYDRTPLNATVVSRDSTSADWIREDIEFDVPGSNQRMWAALFLPRRVQAPYQTVVFWPASDAFILRDRRNLAVAYVDYIARSGRAVLYPIFEHTYGRGSPSAGDVVAATIEHRDQVLRWAKEMRRSIDYIATRSDIDTTRIGFLGTSWGARMAGVVLAIEPRLKTAVLNVAGISARELRAEEDPVNFLPRIRMPVLMLSGRYDSVFPFETSQKPFLRLLGSPPGDKQQILFDGGHFLPRTMMVAESLKWLDRYLGPIVRQ